MACASRKEARAARPRLGRAKRAVIVHRTRLTSCNGAISSQANIRSSRAAKGCSVRARAVAAGRAGCLSSLAVRETRGCQKARFTRGLADSPRSRIIAPSRTRDRRGHVRAVAKAPGGARQRAHGCAATIGAKTAPEARKACGFERRAGSEARGGIQVCADRAAAIDASVDGVHVAVVGPNIHGTVSAKHWG